jgi:chorismate--pyruvate lyase
VTATSAKIDSWRSLPRWQRQTRAPLTIPPPWRPWLLDQGSLTARLVAASDGAFGVEVLAQALRRPSRHGCTPVNFF